MTPQLHGQMHCRAQLVGLQVKARGLGQPTGTPSAPRASSHCPLANPALNSPKVFVQGLTHCCGSSMPSVLGSFAGPSTSGSHEHRCSPCARAGPFSGRPLVHVKLSKTSHRRSAERPQAVAAKAAPVTTEAPAKAKAPSTAKQTDITPEVCCLSNL